MLIYPVGESKTDYTFLPWATIVIMVASIVGFLVIDGSLKRQQAAARAEAKTRLITAVEAQFTAGNLDKALWIAFQENHGVVVDPQHRAKFNEGARQAWLDTQDKTPVLLQLVNKPLRNLALAITPHHLLLLLVGLACLYCMGFLLEHQYALQVILGMFVISGCSWVLLDRVLPPSLLPNPVFAWANTVTVILVVGWMTAPTARISLVLHGWLIKPIHDEVEVPSLLFPAGFLLTYTLVTHYLSGYVSQFALVPLVTVTAQAIVFSLLLMVVPSRPPRVTLTPAQEMDRDLANAKIQFESKRPEEAVGHLRKILVHEPDLKRLHAVADMAWRNNEHDLAEQCYRSLLRKRGAATNEASAFLKLVDEMLFRNLTVAPQYLVSAINVAISEGLLATIRKLLPHFLNNEKVDRLEMTQQMEKLAEKLMSAKEPDRLLLLQVREWLEAHAQHSEVLPRIAEIFKESVESKLTGHFSAFKRVHRLVEIDLIDITADRVTIQVRGQKEQRIPWTAVAGLYGCHIATGSRGYRGCLVVRFKRKQFGCVFATPQILMREGAAAMTFERAWSLLSKHIPEDLPLLAMKDFPALQDDANLSSLVEAFLNLDCEVSPQ